MNSELQHHLSDTGPEKIEADIGHHEKIDINVQHQEYLIQRHGTFELGPLPSSDPQDPLNWPEWRKNVYLGIFAFHGMLAGFMAAGLVPAAATMAELYGKSLSAVSYLVSAQIALYGVTPFAWLPMMQRFGRRPCLLISVLGACACNIGGGFCKTYSQQMATRCLTAIFISPPCALGSIVVTELFFSHQRGTKTGWWKFMFALGAPAGPFIMGFVTKYAGLKWVYFTFSFINFAVFLAYLLFAPETLYDRHAANKNNGEDFGWAATLKFHRVQRKAVSLRELLEPFQLLATLRITVPICVYAIVFAYANIAVVITMPQVFGQKFHLDAEGVGLQFIALMIGLLLGEQIGGRGSDLWMKRKTAARGGQRVIEDRLWLAYLGFVCVIVGLVIWGVRMQQAAPLRWNVTPDVGAAIDSVGCQIVTTVLITYAIDVNPARAADTGLMLNLIRQTWGFIGPFYFSDMFENLGFGGAAGVMAAVVGVAGGIPILIIQFSNIGVRDKHTVQGS